MSLQEVPRLRHTTSLPLLFSFLPDERQYSADSGRWAEAIMRLRDRYKEQYPGFFEEIQFAEKPGSRPYSPEVSEILTELQWGSVLQVINPSFARLSIRKPAQEELRDELISMVDDEVRSAANKLAAELAKDEALNVGD